MSYLPTPVIEITAQTIGNNPLVVAIASEFPAGTTYRAVISAVDVTSGAFVDYAHWLLLGTYFVSFTPADLFTNTAVASGGPGIATGWTAAFVDNAGAPSIEITGSGPQTVDWKIRLETIATGA